MGGLFCWVMSGLFCWVVGGEWWVVCFVGW